MTKIVNLDKFIRKVPNFPKKGILFYDITGILASNEAFQYCIDMMVEQYKDKNIDAVAAIESRGFIFAAPFALRMGIPLVLIRKKGKLPGKTFSKSYNLEYGTAELEIQSVDVKPGWNILLLDDLIATGGTIEAAKELVEMAGAHVPGIFGVIGLPALHFTDVLKGVPITTLVNYEGE